MDMNMTIKMNKADVQKFFICPLCNNLYDHPTTISECLHTFCRKCLNDKFMTERRGACPTCKVDLGPMPCDNKLRLDYSKEDIMQKLVKTKTESVKEKEKSLTSPMASTSISPDVPVEPNVVVVEEKQSENVVAPPRDDSLDKRITTFMKRERKASLPKNNDSGLESEQPHKEPEVKKFRFDLNEKPDNQPEEEEAFGSQKEKDSEKDGEVIPIVSDHDTPPQVIIESNELDHQDPILDTEERLEYFDSDCVLNRQTDDIPVQMDMDTVEVSGQKQKKKGKGKQKCGSSRARKMKRKKVVEKRYSLRPRKSGRTIINEAAASSSEVVLALKAEKKVNVQPQNVPIYFSLVAMRNHQNIDLDLPQISVACLRVKNRNMTVEYVKKYIVSKLKLESEDQVEIFIREERVTSELPLHKLVDYWVQTTESSERRTGIVGSSAADFVMVLDYCLKDTSQSCG